MDGTTQTFAILTILLAATLSLIITQLIRRRRDLFTLRDIPAYQAMPVIVGEVIEANRPLHLSFGSAGIGGEETLLALSAAELFYHVTRRASIGVTAPLITFSDATGVPLTQDTLRKAYRSRNLPDRYPGSNVRWYPQGPRSLVFAAALTAMMGDENVGGNIVAGSFGPELALVAGAAGRRGTPIIATSSQPEGQAVALAMSDVLLIGEEIFTAGAYFEPRPAHVAGVVTQDILRWVVILFIILLAIIEIFASELGDVLDAVL